MKVLISSTFILIIAVLWFIFPRGKPSRFFQKFSNTTIDIFDDINSIYLPATNTMMEHTVTCRVAANMVERSPAFESHGIQIVTGLREFGEKIREVGHSLQKMDSKSSSICKSFDIEIKAMIHRLNSNDTRKGDAKYFKERLNVLITKIKDFRELAEKAHNSIHNAENIKHNTERYIRDGLREAENFILNNNYDNYHYISIDIADTKKELRVTNNILNYLHNSAGDLDKMKKILKDFENKLMDASIELDDVDTLEVTEKNLNL